MNKIIVITGGTSGLGKELLKESINRGFFVCNLARNEVKMKELELKYKENYKGFIGDINSESSTRADSETIKTGRSTEMRAQALPTASWA